MNELQLQLIISANDLILSVLLFGVTALLIYGIVRIAKKRKTNGNGQVKPEICLGKDCIIPCSIAEGEIKWLEENGLQEFLMKNYLLPRVIAIRNENERTQEKLSQIMMDILRYLKLPPYVTLFVKKVKRNEEAGKTWKAGEFTSSNGKAEINLTIGPEDTVKVVLAALCHECTHYFMLYHGMNWNDEGLNEIRTDVTANLIGFSHIMQEGYREAVTVNEEQNVRTTRTRKIGYISANACRQIRNMLDKYRREYNEKEKKEKRLKEEKKHLRSISQTASDLVFHLKNLDPKAKTVTDEKQLQQIQSALSEYEGKDFDKEIDMLNTKIEECESVEELDDIRKQGETICEEILQLISIFK